MQTFLLEMDRTFLLLCVLSYFIINYLDFYADLFPWTFDMEWPRDYKGFSPSSYVLELV